MPVDKGAEGVHPAVMRLGIALRAAREAAGMTQEQLALLSTVSQSSVSRLEVGSHDPRVSEVIKLEAALGLHGGALLVDAEIVSGLASVELAIAADQGLSREARQWLTEAYRAAAPSSRPQQRSGDR